MGAYKQIRNQEAAILCDIDEDNFDRAFDLIRPGEFPVIRYGPS
jgi:flavine halogenase